MYLFKIRTDEKLHFTILFNIKQLMKKLNFLLLLLLGTASMTFAQFPGGGGGGGGMRMGWRWFPRNEPANNHKSHKKKYREARLKFLVN